MEGLLVGRGQAVTGASCGRQCDGDALIPTIKLACRLYNGGPRPRTTSQDHVPGAALLLVCVELAKI